jgi:hypothetical protein
MEGSLKGREILGFSPWHLHENWNVYDVRTTRKR